MTDLFTGVSLEVSQQLEVVDVHLAGFVSLMEFA
jgi:hypothetical protein